MDRLTRVTTFLLQRQEPWLMMTQVVCSLVVASLLSKLMLGRYVYVCEDSESTLPAMLVALIATTALIILVKMTPSRWKSKQSESGDFGE